MEQSLLKLGSHLGPETHVYAAIALIAMNHRCEAGQDALRELGVRQPSKAGVHGQENMPI
jgi:hypothetical protein